MNIKTKKNLLLVFFNFVKSNMLVDILFSSVAVRGGDILVIAVYFTVLTLSLERLPNDLIGT